MSGIFGVAATMRPGVEPRVVEPDKSAGLRWFDLDALPDTTLVSMVPVGLNVREALES